MNFVFVKFICKPTVASKNFCNSTSVSIVLPDIITMPSVNSASVIFSAKRLLKELLQNL